MIATNKHIPGKRIKTWWRNAGRRESLRAYARLLAGVDDSFGETANRWLAGKASK